jgi:hypothetical protein
VLASLGGYGAQFNQHVYAAITGAPPGSLPDLEAKVKALEPQLARIFFNDQQEAEPDKLASFVNTVELADEAEATINITYQSAARAKFDPPRFMRQFADVLENLVRTRGLSRVRWVTIQNEPNSTAVTLAQYEGLYRSLHAELAARGLRDHIGLMGGDLVESGPGGNQTVWFDYMARNMNDILDAYSVHIYWNYWDIPRMEFRLKSVREVVQSLPADAQKPTYVMEFGVRGLRNLPGKTDAPGYWEDGTQITRTNIAAFQQLWFAIGSAQLGVAGASKWDAFWGRYDNSSAGNQLYWMIGPPWEGSPLTPTYHAMSLLYHATAPGWQIIKVEPWAEDDWSVPKGADGIPKWDLRGGNVSSDLPEKELAAYAGPNGELTIMGLDTNGRDLNGVSDKAAGSYSIGGLPASTTFNLALWNATGDGENTVAGTVTSNAAGVARFDVPLQAAFALTTVPVS